ncbi:hypothetical protein [Chondromyces apiculatus]|nr:hypothetical protein [Chondromyces apiculatus]
MSQRPHQIRFRLTAVASLAAALALALAPAATARAQTAAPGQSAAMGQTLFEEGRKLMEAKQYAEACPKFEESLRIRPGMGTLLNLALCNEAIGKTATAWVQFKEVMFAAKKDGNTAREAFAKEHIDALEPKLSRLQIDAAATPGLVVRRDNEEVPAAALRTPIPVDPGKHTIEATAPGHSVWSTTIAVGAVADRKTVSVPELLPLPEETAQAPGAGTAGSGADKGNTLRTVGFVVGGVGIASLGVGAVFGALAAGQASSAEDDQALCPNKQCTPAGRAEIDAAGTKALVSTIGIGVGVAAIGAGVTMILLSGRSSRPEGAAVTRPPVARIVPELGPQGGGVHLIGAF